VDRRRLIVAALSVPWISLYAAQASTGVDARVLFVGNSITAANDLPAVFRALAAAYGRPCRTQELLRPGAPLDAFVADGSLERRLRAEQFSHVILQERGGDYLCAFGPASCEIALRALSAAAGAVRQTGASPLLLGSYQLNPRVAAGLESAEHEAAAAAGVAHINVSAPLLRGRQHRPDARWLATDGHHPGADLTLLMAALVHDAVLGQAPRALPDGLSVPRAGAGPLSFTADAVTTVLRAMDARQGAS
jgi:hypothetical protein